MHPDEGYVEARRLRSLDLDHQNLPIERALGVHWHIEFDKLGFHITIKDKLNFNFINSARFK